jgi:hypothetical protein
MDVTKLIRGLAIAALFFAVQPVAAHHSGAMFDSSKVKEITGTVKEFQWKNPHIWIQVMIKNADGVMEEWSVEGGGPNSLSRQGWRATTFKPGDVVTLRISPMKDGSHAGGFRGARFSDGKTLGRWDEN